MDDSVSFFSKFLDLLRPGMWGVDLGAGDGTLARYFAEAGCDVLAIDRAPPGNSYPGVTWRQQRIEDWHAGDLRGGLDFVFLARGLHFLPRPFVMESLLPGIAARLRPGGLIAISTFTRPPKPDFSHSHWWYYSLPDLRAYFHGWEILSALEFAETSPGRFSAELRQWHHVKLIVRRL